ncbi:hypothetical protein H0A36_22810 [Endozoicomonas sp. SM1973]|uniref:Metal-dependent HD superfamily phosphohydrolase n=1 Tax=Spartinivicinus marinus TaxID=2994442 RepID=A0A853IFP7_9GAMM|nr:hypothetical protein [Spartinivicinus marinus]MCX4025876.1 hypothetical protein [Spartinivicinus marinus]NYZ68854.1 hypothetical protein [Spartinivicinus marinus]
MNNNLLDNYWLSYIQPSHAKHTLVVKQILKKLARQYRQPWRYYHTLNHIEQMLLLFQQYESSISSPPTVFFSICFHDYYYLPWRKNNEKRSATKAIKELHKLHLGSLSHDVEQIILATEKHLPIADQFSTNKTDAELLLDFDLAILGSQWKNYLHYCQQIRKEYWFVPKNKYQTGRKKILTAFLKREQLYFSEPFFTQLEQQARKNIQREIQLLS